MNTSIQKLKVEYTNGKTTFNGELFWDDAQKGPRPGIVVFPEAFGLNDHCRQRAERLAKLGYVAFAADPHGGGAVFTDMAALRPSMQALFSDRAEWRSRARAALDTLVKNPLVDAKRTAAIGFCFGGTTCFELARSGAPLSAIVTFHAGLLPGLPEDAGRIAAKVLVCHGSEDPLLKNEVIEAVMAELRRDKVDWQFTYYGNTSHSFTDPDSDARNAPGFAYSKRSEDRSWQAMRYLFDEVFA
jgi:dienelactone hydrolase